MSSAWGTFGEESSHRRVGRGRRSKFGQADIAEVTDVLWWTVSDDLVQVVQPHIRYFTPPNDDCFTEEDRQRLCSEAAAGSDQTDVASVAKVGLGSFISAVLGLVYGTNGLCAFKNARVHVYAQLHW